MRTYPPRLFSPKYLVLSVALLVGFASLAHATAASYGVSLSGPNESPPNASPGIGTATVDVDDVAHTMHVHIDFSGLVGTTSASHIHSPTVVAGTGTAGVATQTPTFTGFPLGVTAGTYDHVFDMSLASSYNAPFIPAHGGTPLSAEAFLYSSMAAGTAYLNVHSSAFPGGEIRGFLTPLATAAQAPTWGQIRRLYR